MKKEADLPDTPVESPSDETATEEAPEVLEPVEPVEEPAKIEPDAEASAPAVPVVATPAPAPVEEEKLSWFQRLKKGLSRSSSALTDGISSIFTKRKLDAAMLEELEDILIQADLGVDTAMAITERLSDGRYDKEISPEEVREILSEEVEKVLAPVAEPLDLNSGKKPHVVLMVGRQRDRQDHHHRQALQEAARRGQDGHAGRRRHVPRGSCRTAQDLG